MLAIDNYTKLSARMDSMSVDALVSRESGLGMVSVVVGRWLHTSFGRVLAEPPLGETSSWQTKNAGLKEASIEHFSAVRLLSDPLTYSISIRYTQSLQCALLKTIHA